MYRFRLRFFVHAAGVLQNEERTFNFDLPSGISVTLSCLDKQTISEGKEFVLSGGGFREEQEAYNIGNQLKISLLFSGLIFHIGIDLGKDIANTTMSSGYKDKYLENHGAKLIENVHGLSVYSEEYPVNTLSMCPIQLVSPSTVHIFVDTLAAMLPNGQVLSDKEILCLELYGASHFEKSDRARFLTLILALEALRIPEERNEKTRQLVDSFLELTKKSDLQKNEKRSIISSLQWLYNKSIGQSLKDMANTYLEAKEYNGVSATKFITQCYDVRSKLVHDGKVNEDQINIGVLAAQLNTFISDIFLQKFRL